MNIDQTRMAPYLRDSWLDGWTRDYPDDYYEL